MLQSVSPMKLLVAALSVVIIAGGAYAFTVVPSATTGKVVIQAALSTGGPTAYTCATDATGATATCATTSPQLTAALLSGITVVAAQ